MDNEKLMHFKNLLLKEKNKVLSTIHRMNLNDGIGGIAQREYYQELSLLDNHPADMASEVYEVEKNYALEDNEKNILRQIEDALQKIENGNYGICENCGQPIEEERLEAIPYTTLCSSCAKEKDLSLKDLKNSRPNEEKVIKYPFGWGYKDKKGEIQFDAEDTFQEVARFNKTRSGSDHYGEVYDEENAGYVEETDKISNEDYKKTL
ncbi:yteA family sporulation protein [Caldanaerobacter subterraneus]|uniref:DnaK suppressor protein n=1 Tax=Caldanaerobacter subterraneus subsp. pacificus DSM 12653 TaxID=391606 RepID=A0A0F5PNU0_9THEO|nr:yteA family sporulation protein [Caldanaerobacter subterraneus]KKC29524.1 DnaK suppressor protein [Caldanaerobacter subterraneus subsp. pacificus DSM 12653]